MKILELKEIDIYGTKYSIEYVDSIVNKEGNLLFGEQDGAKKTIKISTIDLEGYPLPESELLLSLLHEIFHAILGEGAYSTSNNDEPQIEWLAKNLRHLLPSLCQIV